MMWWGQAIIDRSQDVVEFITADEQNVYLQSRSGMISAFSIETGQRRWNRLLGAPERVGFPGTTNDEQFLVCVGMKIVALDKMTGQVIWELRAPELPSVSPEVDDTQVYVGTVDGSVYAYDISKMRELQQEGRSAAWDYLAKRWRRQTSAEITSQPISTGATVAFASKRGVVVGVNTKDKQPRFDFYSDGRITTPVGRSDDLIFIPDENGRLFCINQDNGKLKWTYSFGTQIVKQPKAIAGNLFAIPNRRGMECLSTANGYQKWVQPRATEFVGASKTRLYASDISGNLLIMNLEDGEILSALPMRAFSVRINNDRTDRLILSTPGGQIICLREQGAEFPVYHLFPERQPILPELGSDGDMAEAPVGEAPAAAN